ncbi:hypothetical protein [Azotobacter chroococcum]|uniref:hypothetical protein n=1 Tax=Azotobacter chroococcum TaxID=353 RepID=UPI0010AEDDAE|nr:hypothetical protein [Azotobacter chroococcum]TKD46938.1 hypothetical protein FCG41_01035 [Azotobacter chroococcum]
MQIDRQQLAAIGQDHLYRQLLDWYPTIDGQTALDACKLPALIGEARARGLSTQRGVAAWILAKHLGNTASLDAQEEIRTLQADLQSSSLERSLLLETWLAGQTPPGGDSAPSGASPGPSATPPLPALRQHSQAWSRQALEEAERSARLADSLLHRLLEQHLPALTTRFESLPPFARRSLGQAQEALQQYLQRLQQLLHATLEESSAATDPGSAGTDVSPPPDAALFKAQLEIAWEQVRSGQRHEHPRLLEQFEEALDQAYEQTPPPLTPALEYCQAELQQIRWRLAALPALYSGALAAASAASLGRDSCILWHLERLRRQRLQERLVQAVPSSALHCWLEALDQLPWRFAPVRVERPVEPCKNNLHSIVDDNSLNAALAQVGLFNALQILQLLLEPSLARLAIQLEQATQVLQQMPPQAAALLGPLGQGREAVEHIRQGLAEQLPLLNDLIAWLDLPSSGRSSAAILDETQCTALEALQRHWQSLESINLGMTPQQVPSGHPLRAACESLLDCQSLARQYLQPALSLGLRLARREIVD